MKTLRISLEREGSSVDADIYGDGSKLGVLLAHGTSGDLTHPLLVHFARAFAAAGMITLTFNFPYRQEGRASRDPDSTLESWTRTAADWLKREYEVRYLLLGGKSLGARIASQVVASGYPASGLVFLGYPLHPPHDPSVLRDSHLLAAACPMRFIHGTGDRFAYPAQLDASLARLRDAGKDVTLDRIEGTHGLRDLATRGRTAKHWDELSQACIEWFASSTRKDTPLTRVPNTDDR